MNIRQRRAAAAALPFQNAYPHCSMMDARLRYAAARNSELDTIRAARRTLRADSGARAYTRGMAKEALAHCRPYLANLRAARAVLTGER